MRKVQNGKKNLNNTVARADQIVLYWRACIKALAVKPLTSAWLPARSPVSGKSAKWWDWSPELPGAIMDKKSGEPLTGFPFANHAAWQAYDFAVCQKSADSLLYAYETTKKPAYLQTGIDILTAFAPLYSNYPLTRDADARLRQIIAYDTRELGKTYFDHVGQSWRDTIFLQVWLPFYARSKCVINITDTQEKVLMQLARMIIETHSLPVALYMLDKYHNSMTNYYHAFILAGTIFGERLSVKNLLTGTRYTGADLIQLVVNSPMGLRTFASNAFDRNGAYWELSGSYTGYVFCYLEKIFKALAGYSDPVAYQPCKAVRPFYRKIIHLNPAEILPELWRAAAFQTILTQINMLHPASNDTNYLNMPNEEFLAKWAKFLNSSLLETLAESVRSARKKGGFIKSDLISETSLMPAAGILTARGPRKRMDFHMDWHEMQDYHSHNDPLNFTVASEGYLIITDVGYHLNHPLRYLVSTRTICHNTVTVDGKDSAYHSKGVLHRFIGNGEIKLAEASVPDAYPHCSCYKRALILVEDRYVVDIFRVTGGTKHNYSLLSRANSSKCSLDLKQYPGSLADPEKKWRGFRHLNSDIDANPEFLIHNPAVGKSASCFTVDWTQRDRPDLTARAHLFHDNNAQVILAKIPQQDRRANRKTLDDQILMVRRSGMPGLNSTYTGIIECINKTTLPLAKVARMKIESEDNAAVALKISHEKGFDIIIQSTGTGKHRVKHPDIEMNGGFCCVRYSKKRPYHIIVYNGAVSGAFGAVKSAAVQSARIIGVDIETGLVTLNAGITDANSVINRFVRVKSACGKEERWLVKAVQNKGKTLVMDMHHSSFITMQGVIDQIENSRIFVSSIKPARTPESGSWIRIGNPGDYSCKRCMLETFQQSGLPLRLAGTTHNSRPRECYIGLASGADMDKSDVGKPFWIGGLEHGDDIFTEPIGVWTA